MCIACGDDEDGEIEGNERFACVSSCKIKCERIAEIELEIYITFGSIKQPTGPVFNFHKFATSSSSQMLSYITHSRSRSAVDWNNKKKLPNSIVSEHKHTVGDEANDSTIKRNKKTQYDTT